MAKKPPKLVPVPTSIWDWPDLATTAKATFLWLWLQAGSRPGVVQFRPIDMAGGLGRKSPRRYPFWLHPLQEIGLWTSHSETTHLVTGAIADPDQVWAEVSGDRKPAKRKMNIPEAILSHGDLSAEAKMAWITIWNEHGCQAGDVQFHLMDLASSIGRTQERGARRWWDFLQEYGFATLQVVDRGIISARMHDPEAAASRQGRILLAEAKSKLPRV